MGHESTTEPPSDHPENPIQGFFERQFNDSRTIELDGEKIGFVDLVPEKQRYEMPLLVAPGWAETPETLKNAIESFFDAGRRVVSVEHGRRVPRWSDENVEPILSEKEKEVLAGYHLSEDYEELPVPELLKAKALLAVLDECRIEKADAMAHSEGAMNVVIAALLQPDRFRNIILVGPAGLTDKGEDNALKRTIGGLGSAMQDARRTFKEPGTKEALVRGVKELAYYVAASPAAALEEIGAIAGFNIEELVTKLHEKGLKISIVHGTDEKMFPMEGMQRQVENEAIYEFYPMVGHDHHDIYLPDEAMFIEKVLESMEQKQEME